MSTYGDSLMNLRWTAPPETGPSKTQVVANSVPLVCPSCGREQSPRQIEGAWVLCVKCGAVVNVRANALHGIDVAERQRPVSHEQETDFPSLPRPHQLIETLSQPNNLGLSTLGLALVCTLLLCIPFVGYVAIPLSSLGVMLGLLGVGIAWRQGKKEFAPPLAGMVACALVLILALWPHAIKPH